MIADLSSDWRCFSKKPDTELPWGTLNNVGDLTGFSFKDVVGAAGGGF